MRQLQFRDSTGKQVLITVYDDDAVTVLMDGATTDYNADHPMALSWICMVDGGLAAKEFWEEVVA